jgi:hypothetical protein
MKYIKLFEDYQSVILNNISNVNEICYGNPTAEKNEVANSDSPIRDWFIAQGIADKIISEAPTNDSKTTKKDLETLLLKTKRATAEELTFARYIDSVDNLAQCYVDLLHQKNIEITMGDFFGVDARLEPLVFWLKDKINRPRPYQLARTFNLPLFPLMHTDAMSSAYPSGHAATAFLISEYFSRKFPEHRIELLALATKIADSREITGIHYPSDTEISKKIVKIVFENNLIE